VLAAFLTTFLWAGSIVCAWRSTKLIGATEANFWRLALSAGLLAIWANTVGHGLFGDAFPLFLLSGLIGIGVGDTVWFQSLPRLGSRLTTLLTNCFTPPAAALIEWLWLGTTLKPAQLVCGAVILGGVSLALAPSAHLKLTRRNVLIGVAACAGAALAGAVGAVLSRKGYAIADAANQPLDGGTAAFQRQLGGLVVAAAWLLVVRHREIKAHLAGSGPETSVGVRKWKAVWPWVAANGILGQTLGVSFYQVALGQLPAGIVLSISALTPLTVIPLARVVEGERPPRRSLVGTVIAVIGVIGLALQR
jgi:drug/metabolite transporter (DMT)-like permease